MTAHETTPSDAAIGPLVAQAYMNLANSIRSGIPTDSGGAIFTSRGMAYIGLCLSEMVVALRETRAREIEQGRELPELPALSSGLLILIGNYGASRSAGESETERLYRWDQLIGGIKAYARAYGEACRRMGNRDE